MKICIILGYKVTGKGLCNLVDFLEKYHLIILGILEFCKICCEYKLEL